MFEAYFFDKHAETTYRMFKLLKTLNGTPFTVNKLSKQLGLSYQQTYSIYQDILTEIRFIAANGASTLYLVNSAESPRTGTTISAEELQSILAKINTDTFRFFLLNNSLTFRFFDIVFQQDGIDINRFCRGWHISVSTLRRRIEPFRHFLEANRILIDLDHWQLCGDELVIRELMFSFYSEGYRGAQWPFGNLDQSRVKNLFAVVTAARKFTIGIDHTALPTKTNLIRIGVQLMRMQQGHFFTVTPRLPLLLRNFGERNKLFFTSEYLPEFDPSTLHSELNYYYCAQIGHPTMNVHESATTVQLRKYFDSFQNPINAFANQLIEALCIGLPPLNELHFRADKIVRTNIYKTAFQYYLMDGNFVKPSDFANTDELLATGAPLIAKINAFLNNIPEDNPCAIFSRYQHSITQSLFNILLPVLADFANTPTLSVKLQMESLSFVARDMLNFLRDACVIRILNSDAPEPPDLIVTSVPNVTAMYEEITSQRSVNHGVPVFYWGTDSNDGDLYNLMRQLISKAGFPR